MSRFVCYMITSLKEQKPLIRYLLIKPPLHHSLSSVAAVHTFLMPRKPQRHHHSLRNRNRPFRFSSFARSKSIASANKVKPQEVQADFAGSVPKPDDFHGVKLLLQTYLDDKEWDLSGFVDLILQETTIGTVVKEECDEDESVYAVASVLNLDRYKDQKCIKELKDFLLESCQEKSVLSNLKSILGKQAQGVGLLVSGRVLNLPPQLLPPLYDSLFNEEDEPTHKLRRSFCIKHYLVITKIYVHKHSNRKSGSSTSENEAVIFIKPEEEILYELCSWSFNFPVKNQSVTPKEFKNYKRMGLVMAVEASKISAFQQQLELNFAEES